MRQRQIRRSSVQAVLAALFFALPALGAGEVSRARADSADEAQRTQGFDAQMQPILQRYLRIGKALANDSMDGVHEESKAIGKLAGKLDVGTASGDRAAHYADIPRNLEKAAEALSGAKALREARDSFKQLSMPMVMWVTMSEPKGVDVVHCSMAKASWVQRRGEARNPYYGSAMLKCGQVLTGGSPQKPSR